MLDYGSESIPAQHRKAFTSRRATQCVFNSSHMLLSILPTRYSLRVSIDVPSFEIVYSDQGRVQVVGFYKKRVEWKRWILPSEKDVKQSAA